MDFQSEILIQLTSGSGKPILVVSHHQNTVTFIKNVVADLGFRLFRLVGSEIRNKDALFEALNHTMKFPAYFGRNWDALEECLCDLERDSAEGYVILFEEPKYLFEASYDTLITFLEVVIAVSMEWAADQVPFYLILTDGEMLIDLQKHESIMRSIRLH
jgi:RNAse (barnase) inhibitor barstar